MQLSTELVDEKKNPVFTTLFESYLAKFTLENPELYQGTYLKLISEIETFISKKIETFKLTSHQDTLDRIMFSIFTNVSQSYPGFDNFQTLKTKFNLSASDFFIKLIADNILVPQVNETPHSPMKNFFDEIGASRRSPFNPNRNPKLFSAENRGVTEIRLTPNQFFDFEEIDETQTYDLGIVSPSFRPIHFINFFNLPIEPAGTIYEPLESSYVAAWLRKHNCPVISGAAGTIEMMFSRIFPITTLTDEEKKIVIFAQACNMIANGHHSFFEAMLVADDFGFKLHPQKNMKDFYLQCIPQSILESEAFLAFLSSPEIEALPLEISHETSYLEAKTQMLSL